MPTAAADHPAADQDALFIKLIQQRQRIMTGHRHGRDAGVVLLVGALDLDNLRITSPQSIHQVADQLGIGQADGNIVFGLIVLSRDFPLRQFIK